MGYTDCSMEARKVNLSPVPRFSLAGPFKGHMSIKSSPYCPGSSNKLTNQYMIRDHMLSHYKKVLSAKAAVDSTTPKSLLSSIKYNDQKRRERMSKEVSRYEREVLSAQSASQKSSRSNSRPPSADTIQSNASLQDNGDESLSPYLQRQLLSSPRFVTSFHSKQTAYPPRTVNMAETPSKIFYRSSSELSCSPARRGQHSARSSYDSSSSLLKSPNVYKSFQDPNQKTYSGDLLQKHSYHFTEDKPFTPRTLKKDTKSFLSQYRYYTPPRRKPAKEKSTLMVNQDTQTDHESSFDKAGSPPDERRLTQDSQSEHQWSGEETHVGGLSSRDLVTKTQKNRLRYTDHLYPSSRLSTLRTQSPTMRKVTDEEEELKYLEFITEATNEILTMGLYSNRVLERVFDRHFEMNKHRLDKDKMRHLLDVLRHDLGCTSDSSRVAQSTAGFEEGLESLFPSAQLKFNKEKADRFTGNEECVDSFPADLLNDHSENVNYSSISLPEPSESSGGIELPKTDQNGAEDREEVNSMAETHSELICGDVTNVSGDENDPQNSGQPGDVEDLERSLAESLFVTNENKSSIEESPDRGTQSDYAFSDEEF
ncbi:spermatogenesis-associated protein 7 [Amia ocellicauda]|uniref:spermatogenesis-associated protein 7 n=1 Tax=Amia ocellicauda TaxID=2972642 RepID=UPI003464A2F7